MLEDPSTAGSGMSRRIGFLARLRPRRTSAGQAESFANGGRILSDGAAQGIHRKAQGNLLTVIWFELLVSSYCRASIAGLVKEARHDRAQQTTPPFFPIDAIVRALPRHAVY